MKQEGNERFAPVIQGPRAFCRYFPRAYPREKSVLIGIHTVRCFIAKLKEMLLNDDIYLFISVIGYTYIYIYT